MRVGKIAHTNDVREFSVSKIFKLHEDTKFINTIHQNVLRAKEKNYAQAKNPEPKNQHSDDRR